MFDIVDLNVNELFLPSSVRRQRLATVILLVDFVSVHFVDGVVKHQLWVGLVVFLEADCGAEVLGASRLLGEFVAVKFGLDMVVKVVGVVD